MATGTGTLRGQSTTAQVTAGVRIRRLQTDQINIATGTAIPAGEYSCGTTDKNRDFIVDHIDLEYEETSSAGTPTFKVGHYDRGLAVLDDDSLVSQALSASQNVRTLLEM